MKNLTPRPTHHERRRILRAFKRIANQVDLNASVDKAVVYDAMINACSTKWVGKKEKAQVLEAVRKIGPALGAKQASMIEKLRPYATHANNRALITAMTAARA